MVTLKNVKKSFQGAFMPVLNNVELALAHRDFCVVIGANGCGKSTLLRMISGELLPDAGAVEVSGKVAQVVQDVNVGTVPEMTLLENIALSLVARPKLVFYKRFKSQIIEKLRTLNVGLEEFINRPLNVLSGGQRQMVATLMATASGCEILLLDEHTSALDPKMQVALMKYTAEQIAQSNLTALMITHKMDDAIKYGNRLIMLHLGRIVLDVSGNEKQALKVSDLLALFHKYENQTLLAGG